jgi:hypothetical protein
VSPGLGSLLGRAVRQIMAAFGSVLNIRVGDGSAPWVVMINVANDEKARKLNALLREAGIPCDPELQFSMSWIFCPGEPEVRRVLDFASTLPFIREFYRGRVRAVVYDNYRRDVSRRYRS